MTVTISGDELKELARKATAGRWLSNRPDKYLGTWDSRLYLPTRDEVIKLSAAVWEAIAGLTDGKVEEAFDCDDYAFAYCGIVRAVAARTLGRRHSVAIGIGMGVFSWLTGVEYHVCNWTVLRGEKATDRPRLCWIEPQVNPLSTTRPWLYTEDCATRLRIMII